MNFRKKVCRSCCFFYLAGEMRQAILTFKLFDNYFLDPGMVTSEIGLI